MAWTRYLPPLALLMSAATASCSKPTVTEGPTGERAFRGDAVAKLLDMPRLGAVSGQPFIRGKYVFIDGDERVWSPFNRLYPASEVAQRPSEVGTIFLETRTQKEIAQYTGGVKGIGTTSRIQVIDVAQQNIVGEKTFEARMLPKGQTRGVDDKSAIMATGSNEEIADWLRALPRR